MRCQQSKPPVGVRPTTKTITFHKGTILYPDTVSFAPNDSIPGKDVIPLEIQAAIPENYVIPKRSIQKNTSTFLLTYSGSDFSQAKTSVKNYGTKEKM
jgi:hypothetical protein